MNTKRYLLFLAALLSFSLSLSSCSTTDAPPDGKNPIGERKLFVVNEGGFGKGNASIDVFNYTDSVYTAGVKVKIGDVANDIQLIDGKLYVTLNGSSKLIAYDTALTVGTSIQFSAGMAPARIIKTADGEAMMTSLYTDTVYVIDTKVGTIKYRVKVAGGTRGLAALGGNAYIANAANGVTVINTNTRSVTEVQNLATTPYEVIADSARGALLLVGVGNFSPALPCDLVWVKESDRTVISKITLPATDYFGSLYPTVVAKNKVYLLLGNRVAAVDMATRTIANDSFIPKAYYGGIYDAKRDELILGDAKDFQNNGAVDVYDAATGKLKKSYIAGVAPAHFYIYQK